MKWFQRCGDPNLKIFRSLLSPFVRLAQVLLGLLGARPGLALAHVDRLRALAARVLLGLARDPNIRHILAKLQVHNAIEFGTVRFHSLCSKRRLLTLERSARLDP